MISTLKDLVRKIGQNFITCFSSKYLLWHILAILLTYIIVKSGTDWKYFVFFQKTNLVPFAFTAALVGFVVPVLLPLGLILFRKTKAALIVIQAQGIAWLIAAFYKSLSGRLPPQMEHVNAKILDMVDIIKMPSGLADNSHIFKFGLYRGGIFWGWPSSHTTIAFAMAITIWYLFPKNKVIKIVALIYAIYIGFGVSFTIHWFSDAIAGAIFGIMVGVIVGRSFLQNQ